ncbi:methyl-accepting chemotaxis protein [Alkalihalobacillus sp. BA299]|uniref:methyl-accepting chemotaxis protein n=1 Tax=Alkalihalobacillus sp. BA299 TaxID=2815938 RepID=UPI001ADCADF4|nr:HAMP domain-containing methyl-accepting chemotaxis protein [Alkalihalobacillus sp. BA299]
MIIGGNQKLKYKLFVIFLIVLLLFFIGSSLVFYHINSVSQDVDTFQSRNNTTVLVNEVQSRVNSMYIEILDYERNGRIDNARFQDNKDRLAVILEQIEPEMETERQKELYQGVRDYYLMFEGESDNLILAKRPKTQEETIERIGQLSRINGYRNRIMLGSEDLTRTLSEHLSEASNQVRAAISYTKLILIVSILTAVIMGTLLIVFFSHSITKRLNQVVTMAETISRGNLNVSKISENSKDEIGQLGSSMNLMSDNLRLLVNKILNASEQVASSSEQLTACSHETGKAGEQITESIQQIAISSEKQLSNINSNSEIASNISERMDKIKRNVQAVLKSSFETAKTSESGNEMIELTIDQMKTIYEKTNATSNSVEQLEKKSNEIDQIVSLITNVSDQTNLLALNAAIEAARAGDHGKGFAVVANEVRMLAEQSSNAARQISELVNGIQGDIYNSALSMGEGRTAVKEGLVLAERAGGTFAEIFKAINKATKQIEEVTLLVIDISTDTEGLAESFNETKQIVESAAGYTQSVAATSEEQNASMQEIVIATQTLSSMAEELQNAVLSFKL